MTDDDAKRVANEVGKVAHGWNCNTALVDALGYVESEADLRQIADAAYGPGSAHVAEFIRAVLAGEPVTITDLDEDESPGAASGPSSLQGCKRWNS